MDDKNIDADILKCKADVLRARNEAGKETAQDKQPDKVEVEVRAIRAVKIDKKPTDNTAEEKSVEIPKFDLADQMLAQQRSVASTRRRKTQMTSHIEKSYPANDTVGEIIRQSKPGKSEPKTEVVTPPALRAKVRSINLSNEEMSKLQKQLVADIVSRDIALLCN